MERSITAKVNKAGSMECRVLLKNIKTGKFWKSKKAPKNDPGYEEFIQIANGKPYITCDSPNNNECWDEEVGEDWVLYLVPPVGNSVYEWIDNK